MFKLGIDIGSRNTKVVIFNEHTKSIEFSDCKSTEIFILSGVNKLLHNAFLASGINKNELTAIGVTGYGRKLFKDATLTISEISCHTAGCLYYFPDAKTIIDMGGQDSKIITLTDSGKVKDFVMNDKCAAGTGRFLEMTAMRLDCDVSDLSAIASKSTKELKLNSTCVVFAESEIIGMLSSSTAPENIVRSVHRSIAKRILAQMASLVWEPPIVFTGGVALNQDIVKCFSESLSYQLITPPDPEITAALGAAILA
ncbi:MAG TPA: acyl-CoA dehydratase activase [Candidatus Cloacimonas sp.]|jgi:predicted CoA-substrate-specific enzyme activase|nr:2-hydroxyglutaryl-CoA dehydratase [Candidatus Cloacimonas sp.]MDD2249548.1 acyl-CoA dehydratase activase [Candidatus Cloacimonadota bacterium]MCK9157222.1 acyl-CoA dehydratase activase [Candidatus Cloacimonas sp.]MCK9164286.1 acyl-CoA dehydratase activase [Candidatus Cloacimonas sp.]MDD3733354.1 acyl-CoA dehydratase activase [Candidatus Cloacimonadota bacterium]